MKKTIFLLLAASSSAAFDPLAEWAATECNTCTADSQFCGGKGNQANNKVDCSTCPARYTDCYTQGFERYGNLSCKMKCFGQGPQDCDCVQGEFCNSNEGMDKGWCLKCSDFPDKNACRNSEDLDVNGTGLCLFMCHEK